MFAWPSKASYGADLSDSHNICTAASRLLMALTFQTLIALAQQSLLLSHGSGHLYFIYVV